MSDPRCKCTLGQSLTGDGCRYCQPQEHIDRLYETITDIEATVTEATEENATLRNVIEAYNEGPWLLYSNEKFMWWSPGRHLHTDNINKTDRYTKAEAQRICFHANRTKYKDGRAIPPKVIMVRAPEAE